MTGKDSITSGSDAFKGFRPLLAAALVMVALLPPPVSFTQISVPTDMGARLRAVAARQQLFIGSAAEPLPIQTQPAYAEILASQFNMLTPENAMKMSLLRPNAETYAFEGADYLVDFAAANGMAVRGHTLVWHEQLPAWLEQGSFTRDELLGILRDHITTVVTRYRGRVYAWDVVNEAVDNDGSLRKSLFWEVIGPDYIDYAFRWAREADPNALLFYNDNGGDGLGQKSDGIYWLAQSLVERGVPIDGVGLQMHTSIGNPPDADEVRLNMDRIADLGLQVHITEMDVRTEDGSGNRAQRLEAQANIYASIAEVCIAHPACTAFVTWGFSDWNYAQAGRDDTPLLFDAEFRPKPAYWSLLEALQQTISPAERRGGSP